MTTAAKRPHSQEPAWALVSPRWNGKLAIRHRDDLPENGLTRGEIVTWVSSDALGFFGVDEATLERPRSQRREGAVR
jgi:hypothetical protein